MSVMEVMYKSMYLYSTLRHYEILLRSGYTYAEAGAVVQEGMDRVWKIIKGNGSKTDVVHPHGSKHTVDEKNPFEE